LAVAQPTVAASGVDLTAINKSINPCTDFYQYACGTWNKNNPIPPEYPAWGRFNELSDRNQEELRQVAEDAAKNQSRSALDQKVGAFYSSCMDEAAVDKAGFTPLNPLLGRIDAITSKEALLALVAGFHNRGVAVLFRFSASPDPDNSRVNIADMDQGGLGLPERDFYLRTDARSVELRQKYQKHIDRILQLVGDPADKAAAHAAAVLAFETELAKASLDRVSRRNPHLLVHKMAVADFEKLLPAFDFAAYVKERGAPSFSTLNVSVPDFIKGLNAAIESASLDTLKAYVAWHLLHTDAPLLSKPFVDENFDFYTKTLTGAQVLQPRWKRCVALTDRDLGEALGQKFVEKYFGQVGKQKTLEMVGLIERAMATDIDSLTWMSDETKRQALVKLKGVTNKIGYPEHYRNYAKVTVEDGDLLGNSTRAREFDVKRRLSLIGQPVDRDDWSMSPPTVNAYYNPSENNINFPAGILQPPFFTASADMAVNFGGIGAVVGHELTHGFDDQGRQFDDDGNLRDWWKAEDAAEFKKRADCLVKEYSSFAPLPDQHIKGELTLGENGADNAGMHLAYMALMTSIEAHTVSAASLDGYTPQQRFFLGFGQIWCGNMREPALRVRLQTDPHSPGEFRVNGTVRNMPEFSDAFGCKQGDPMFAEPDKACRVW
jgi:putative endopeptidase